MKNDYYEIAYNNLLYLEHSLSTTFYNDIAVNAQQVAEKMLKSVLEYLCDLGDELDKLLRSHNLRAIYDKIHNVYPEFCLDRGSLSILKDFYFDAKYPGDNFVTVTFDECAECIGIMYDAIEETNKFRASNGLSVHEVTRKQLYSTYANSSTA